MSTKKSYNRFFIILQEEDKGYGMGPDRPPTGYVKVETKNDKSKVTVYAQNLKPFETGEYLYRCYLISHQDSKDSIAYLGIMNIDESGRGESSWESGAEDAFSTNVSVDKFNAASIVADREGMGSVIAPLAGYMSKEKFEWRSALAKERQKQASQVENVPEIEETKEEVQPVQEAQKFEEYEKQVEEAAKITLSQEAEPAREPETEPEPLPESAPEPEGEGGESRNEEEKYQPQNEVDEEIPEKIDVEDTEEEIRSKHKHCEKEYEKPHYIPKHDFRTTMKRMLEDILWDYEEFDGCKDLKDCRLWKVDMDKCGRDGYMASMYPYFDLVFYLMLYNPAANYFNYISRYGHYLFGIKYGKDGEVCELVYGIPGRNAVCDQPYMGKTGFLRWIPRGKNGEGYWIMMYDPITGRVNIPKR